MEPFSDITAVTLVGFAGGVVLGLAARIGRFCTLGAIEDALYGSTRDRILMWPLAIGVAIAATAILTATGSASVETSAYLRFEFSATASLAGGLMFGIGMALAGNCGFGALARVGGGDIRSLLIVLAIGISAYMTAIGPLAEIRMALFPRHEVANPAASALTGWIAGWSGIAALDVALAIAIALVAVAVALQDRGFAANRRAVLWSALVGLACASAWWGTSYVAATGFDVVAIESHTFTMPLGEIVLQAMGVNGRIGGFSVGSVAGVLTGAFFGACLQRQFRWEACDDPGELRRQIFGGVLMGIGGVIALGCSIGQGLSAFSVLALSAPVTTAAIVLGAVLGLRYLVEGRRGYDLILSPLDWLLRRQR